MFSSNSTSANHQDPSAAISQSTTSNRKTEYTKRHRSGSHVVEGERSETRAMGTAASEVTEKETSQVNPKVAKSKARRRKNRKDQRARKASKEQHQQHAAEDTSSAPTSESDEDHSGRHQASRPNAVEHTSATTSSMQKWHRPSHDRSTNTTPHHRASPKPAPTKQLLNAVGSTRPVFPRPAGCPQTTLFMSPLVHCVVDDEGHSYIRTLEGLLKYGTAGFGNEPDTPFLSPSAPDHAQMVTPEGRSQSDSFGDEVRPAQTAANAEDMDDDDVYDARVFKGHNPRLPPSPQIEFSVDGVATPNTWGALSSTQRAIAEKMMNNVTSLTSIALPPADDGSSLARNCHSNSPHTPDIDGPGGAQRGSHHRTTISSVLSGAKPFTTPESCMFKFLLADYNPEADTFGYRDQSKEIKDRFIMRITDLCTKVASVLRDECLMAAVATPVYVLGDIHGNFCDLSYFIRSMLSFGNIHLTPTNILCLGDYVDRGSASLECVLLLFALKAEAPEKVTLLRGNHEDRVVCGDRRTYGSDCFLAQCQTIFGVKEGHNVFITITDVFRHLPLAAEIVVTNAPNQPLPHFGVAQPESNFMHTPATLSPSNFLSVDNDSFVDDDMDSVPNTPDRARTFNSVPATPSGLRRNAFGVNPTDPTTIRRMFGDRNWLRRQTHVERILCTHGGIPRFNGPPRDNDALAFLRSPDFPRLLTLFPNNPMMKKYQQEEAERFKDVPDAVMQRAWFTMFDLMWSDPTTEDTNLNEWGFGINTRGNTVVSFSAKAVDTFLQAYQYSMLFRAHQEKAHGIRLSKSNKVLTIFSTSNYLGHGNGAGCVVVSPCGEVQIVVKASQL